MGHCEPPPTGFLRTTCVAQGEAVWLAASRGHATSGPTREFHRRHETPQASGTPRPLPPTERKEQVLRSTPSCGAPTQAESGCRHGPHRRDIPAGCRGDGGEAFHWHVHPAGGRAGRAAGGHVSGARPGQLGRYIRRAGVCAHLWREDQPAHRGHRPHTAQGRQEQGQLLGGRAIHHAWAWRGRPW